MEQPRQQIEIKPPMSRSLWEMFLGLSEKGKAANILKLGNAVKRGFEDIRVTGHENDYERANQMSEEENGGGNIELRPVSVYPHLTLL